MIDSIWYYDTDFLTIAAAAVNERGLNLEGGRMDYSGEVYERTREDSPVAKAQEQHSGIRSVQNLEAVINEGLRVALLEETPDQIGRASCRERVLPPV